MSTTWAEMLNKSIECWSKSTSQAIASTSNAPQLTQILDPRTNNPMFVTPLCGNFLNFIHMGYSPLSGVDFSQIFDKDERALLMYELVQCGYTWDVKSCEYFRVSQACSSAPSRSGQYLSILAEITNRTIITDVEIAFLSLSSERQAIRAELQKAHYQYDMTGNRYLPPGYIWGNSTIAPTDPPDPRDDVQDPPASVAGPAITAACYFCRTVETASRESLLDRGWTDLEENYGTSMHKGVCGGQACCSKRSEPV